MSTDPSSAWRRGALGLVCAAIIFLPCSAQTTTLSNEQSNNTSAYPQFPGWSDGNAAPSNVSKVNLHNYFAGSTKIAVHVEPWWCTNSAGNVSTAPANSGGKTCTVTGHLENGYNSNDPNQVQAQVADMASRGVDLANIDFWIVPTGPTQAPCTSGTWEQNKWCQHNETIRQFDLALSPGCSGAQTGCQLMYLVTINGMFEYDPACGFTGGTKATPTNACVTTALNNRIDFINNNYFGRNAYYKVGGRPVLQFFIDDSSTGPYGSLSWSSIWSSVRSHANGESNGSPLFEFENPSGFTHANSDGAYAWVNNDCGLKAGSCEQSYDWGGPYLSRFYSAAVSSGTNEQWGAAWKGFNDTWASWTLDRIVDQKCGQTWLNTLKQPFVSGYYSASKPVPYMQIVTWNDYEEGTEIETGIDNCLASVTGSVSNNQLNWTPNFGTGGTEQTVDHYTVFSSTDGQNLTVIQDNIPSGTHQLNLAPFNLSSSDSLFVKAVGLPSVTNRISGAISCAGCGSGNVSISPSSFTFGSQLEGTTSAPEAFTVTNSSGTSATAVAISTSGDFGQTNNCGTTIAANSSCTVNVTFTPTATGTRTGTLTVAYNLGGTNSQKTASLSGTGTVASGSGIDDGSWTCSGSCAAATPDSNTQLDGSSVKFSYTGGAAYSSGTYSQVLGNNYSTVSQFKSDFWVEVSDSTAPQALEFDSIQVVGGYQFPFMVQCDFKGTKLWRVWNPANSSSPWVSTGVGCAPITGTWNHFTLHFERTSSNQLHYQDIVINGTTYSFNLYENAITNGSAASMTSRVVLVGDSTPHTYNVWVDEMTLSANNPQGALNVDDGTWSCVRGSCAAAAKDTSVQMDGSSLKLTYTGGAPYTDAMWQTVPSDTFSKASSLTLDLYAYMTAPASSQALEFDAVQIVGGYQYPFQFECDFKNTKSWMVWDPVAQNWISTSVGCAVFTANSWNHLIFHFNRTAGNQLSYQDVVINGSTYTFGKTVNPISDGRAASMTVRTRLVGDNVPDSYSLWLDKMNLTY